MQGWLKILAVLALISSAAATQASPSDAYAISAKLTHAGQSFAEPSAVVLAEKPASIEVSGPDGYKLTLTVSDIAVDEIQVVASLDSSHGSMAPTVIVRPSQPASVSIGDLGLELTVSRSDG